MKTSSAQRTIAGTEYRTMVTRKGQITVPAEIRRALGLKQGDKVAVVLEKGQARLRRAESVVARTAGVFKTDSPPLTAEELREAAERAMAEEAIEIPGLDRTEP